MRYVTKAGIGECQANEYLWLVSLSDQFFNAIYQCNRSRLVVSLSGADFFRLKMGLGNFPAQHQGRRTLVKEQPVPGLGEGTPYSVCLSPFRNIKCLFLRILYIMGMLCMHMCVCVLTHLLCICVMALTSTSVRACLICYGRIGSR